MILTCEHALQWRVKITTLPDVYVKGHFDQKLSSEHTHAHACTHTHTRTRMHTHTHTHSPPTALHGRNAYMDDV